MLKIFNKIFASLFLFLYKTHLSLYKYNIKKKKVHPVFVISVGNLSFGGSGKTPMVELIAKLLLQTKHNFGIVSRGYKRTSSLTTVVSNKESVVSSVADAGDEPYMLAQSLPSVPVVVGKKNQAIKYAYEFFKIKSVILDDSFQSHYIHKNLEIILIDVSIDIAHYQLFPFGFLREPLEAIDRADIIVFTKNNFDSGYKKTIKDLICGKIKRSDVLVVEADYNLQLMKFNWNTHSFSIQNHTIKNPVVAVSGIANPSIFNSEVQKFCCGPVKILSFSDHCRYTKKEVSLIKKNLSSFLNPIILTTKKDFYKLQLFFPDHPFLILDVFHSFNKEGVFLQKLNKEINSFLRANTWADR